jgi:hypothetical protein
MISGTIGQNRRVDNLTTRTAFPCIESTYKIIIFFGVHSTFALGTSHLTTSSLIEHQDREVSVCVRYYTRRANCILILHGNSSGHTNLEIIYVLRTLKTFKKIISSLIFFLGLFL